MIRMCIDCIKEHPKIVEPMYKAMKTVPITHGTCEYHFIKSSLERGHTKKYVMTRLQQIRKENPTFKPAPHLKERPALVKKYEAGIFDEPVAT